MQESFFSVIYKIPSGNIFLAKLEESDEIKIKDFIDITNFINPEMVEEVKPSLFCITYLNYNPPMYDMKLYGYMEVLNNNTKEQLDISSLHGTSQVVELGEMLLQRWDSMKHTADKPMEFVIDNKK